MKADATKLARPYALAAFEYASEHQRIEEWHQALAFLAKLVVEPQVARVLHHPQTSAAERAGLCIALAKDLLDDELCNFLKVCAENRRLPMLPEMLRLYSEYRAAYEKTLRVQVRAAVPLTVAYQDELKAKLSKKLKREIILDCVEDKSLIGGVLVRAGDEVIDNSVRGQLVRLQETLAR